MAREEPTLVKYVWKGGAGLKEDAKAQVVGERLATIERKKGVLKAEFVVDDARNEKSPLHSYFEWDDSAAAKQHRLHQARHLISHIHVKTVGNRDIQHPTRAFVNLRPGPEEDRQYENIMSVMSDEMKRGRLLSRAKEELSSWRSRYEDLNEFANLFPVIDRVLRA